MDVDISIVKNEQGDSSNFDTPTHQQSYDFCYNVKPEIVNEEYNGVFFKTETPDVDDVVEQRFLPSTDSDEGTKTDDSDKEQGSKGEARGDGVNGNGGAVVVKTEPVESTFDETSSSELFDVSIDALEQRARRTSLVVKKEPVVIHKEFGTSSCFSAIIPEVKTEVLTEEYDLTYEGINATNIKSENYTTTATINNYRDYDVESITKVPKTEPLITFNNTKQCPVSNQLPSLHITNSHDVIQLPDKIKLSPTLEIDRSAANKIEREFPCILPEIEITLKSKDDSTVEKFKLEDIKRRFNICKEEVPVGRIKRCKSDDDKATLVTPPKVVPKAPIIIRLRPSSLLEEDNDREDICKRDAPMVLPTKRVNGKDVQATRANSEFCMALLGILRLTDDTCKLCGFRAVDRSELIQHARMHAVNKIDPETVGLNEVVKPNKRNSRKLFTCDRCDFAAATRITVRKHQKRYHEAIEFRCDMCAFVTTSLDTFRSHKKAHLVGPNTPNLHCPLCDYTTTAPTELAIHVGLHERAENDDEEDDEDLACRKAGYERINAGRARYSCTVCEYRTHDEYNIKIHMRTHTGEDELRCEICDYRTHRRGNLEAHVKSHGNEQTFKCPICDFKTSYKYTMRVHAKKEHAGDHRCVQCEFRTGRAAELRSHIKVVHVQVKRRRTSTEKVSDSVVDAI